MEPVTTHATIAKLAGVSPSTVSKVFNNYPGVSADTRQSVHAAAAKLNYKPDPALSALTKRRWNRGHRAESVVIALLWPSGTPDRPSGNLKDLQQGASTRASELGYILRDFGLNEFKSHAQLNQLLHRSGINALISLSIQDGESLELNWNSLYHVFLFGHVNFPHLNQVRYDWHRGVDLAVSHAVNSGHRRIGFLSSCILNNYEERHLLAAYLVNHSELKEKFGPQPRPFTYQYLKEPFANRDFAEFPDYPWERHPVNRWVQKEKPDCIIASDVLSYHILIMNGWKIPRDFSYISLRGGDTEGDYFLTSVSQRPFLQGQSSVDIIHHLLQTGQKGLLPYPIIRTIEGEIHEGKTLKRR